MQKLKTAAYKTAMFIYKNYAELCLLALAIFCIYLGVTFEPVLPSLDR